MSTPYIIGISGSSCSGKTTVSTKILEIIKSTLGELNGNICLISQDSYYRGGDQNTNYDTPEALEFSLMYEHLQKIILGNTVDIPIYDFSTHSRKKETHALEPAKIIIIEGILIFTQEKIRDLCNLKVFVEADDTICYTRRLKRDVKERGRTFEEVEQRYIDHVVPCFNNFIKPSRYHANIILVNNTHGMFVGLDILLDHIEKKINNFK